MSQSDYRRPEHATIARMLRTMRVDFLMDSRCWFAGGTAIVLKNGEYRLSLDVDFLCSSQEGYRALRQAVIARGAAGLFGQPIKSLREARCDQYGLRTIVEVEGRPLRLEIVREARIEVAGSYDADLACPLLSVDDQFAEKLLANSDRGRDPAVCYRDALDLGMLILGQGGLIPLAASAKAVAAYGQDVWRDARRVVAHLRDRPDELDRAAGVLRMDPILAREAIEALARACERAETPS